MKHVTWLYVVIGALLLFLGYNYYQSQPVN